MAEKQKDKKDLPQAPAGNQREGKAAQRKKIKFTDLVFGDFLTADSIRRNAGFIVLVVVCILLYIGNGYSSQQELIELDKLKQETEDAKYNALTRSSELLERSRQSHIEERLEEMGDSALQTATTAPFVLKIDTAE